MLKRLASVGLCCLVLLVALPLVSQVVTGGGATKETESQPTTGLTGTLTFKDASGTKTNQWEMVVTGAPATVNVAINGCMRGGTCTGLVNSTSTANTVLNTTGGPYDSYQIAYTLTGGTSPVLTFNRTGTMASANTSTGISSAALFTYDATTVPLTGIVVDACSQINQAFIAANGAYAAAPSSYGGVMVKAYFSTPQHCTAATAYWMFANCNQGGKLDPGGTQFFVDIVAGATAFPIPNSCFGIDGLGRANAGGNNNGPGGSFNACTGAGAPSPTGMQGGACAAPTNCTAATNQFTGAPSVGNNPYSGAASGYGGAYGGSPGCINQEGNAIAGSRSWAIASTSVNGVAQKYLRITLSAAPAYTFSTNELFMVQGSSVPDNNFMGVSCTAGNMPGCPGAPNTTAPQVSLAVANESYPLATTLPAVTACAASCGTLVAGTPMVTLGCDSNQVNDPWNTNNKFCNFSISKAHFGVVLKGISLDPGGINGEMGWQNAMCQEGCIVDTVKVGHAAFAQFDMAGLGGIIPNGAGATSAASDSGPYHVLEGLNCGVGCQPGTIGGRFDGGSRGLFGITINATDATDQVGSTPGSPILQSGVATSGASCTTGAAVAGACRGGITCPILSCTVNGGGGANFIPGHMAGVVGYANGVFLASRGSFNVQICGAGGPGTCAAPTTTTFTALGQDVYSGNVLTASVTPNCGASQCPGGANGAHPYVFTRPNVGLIMNSNVDSVWGMHGESFEVPVCIGCGRPAQGVQFGNMQGPPNVQDTGACNSCAGNPRGGIVAVSINGNFANTSPQTQGISIVNVCSNSPYNYWDHIQSPGLPTTPQCENSYIMDASLANVNLFATDLVTPLVETGITTPYKATAALNIQGEPLIADAANAGQVIVAGLAPAAGTLVGVLANSCTAPGCTIVPAGGTAFVQVSGIGHSLVDNSAAGTACVIGNFVVAAIAAGTVGNVTCTGTFTAGTILGVATSAAAKGSVVTYQVALR